MSTFLCLYQRGISLIVSKVDIFITERDQRCLEQVTVIWFDSLSKVVEDAGHEVIFKNHPHPVRSHVPGHLLINTYQQAWKDSRCCFVWVGFVAACWSDVSDGHWYGETALEIQIKHGLESICGERKELSLFISCSADKLIVSCSEEMI